MTAPPRPAVVRALVTEHDRFLGFLVRRVRDRELAEDLLQTAILQALRRADTLRHEERVTAWIYRILRNVLADHGRREAAAERAAASAVAPEATAAEQPELEAVICACVSAMLETLPDQYADILRLVELEEVSPGVAAERLGLTPGNARVRLHRARSALRERVEEMCRVCAKHGCLDCTCRAGDHGM